MKRSKLEQAVSILENVKRYPKMAFSRVLIGYAGVNVMDGIPLVDHMIKTGLIQDSKNSNESLRGSKPRRSLQITAKGCRILKEYYKLAKELLGEVETR